MLNKGLLFVMSGPSGTGKGTICEELLKREEELFLSISATSREMRKGEAEGVNYYYHTREEFKKLIDDGEMLEWAEYSGNFYGTPKKKVLERLQRGQNVLLEIEPNGALQVKKMFPEAVLIFIVPPSMAELKRRLETRGRETAGQIDERMAAARWEFEQAPKYNYIIENDDLDACVEEVISAMHREAGARRRIEALLDEKY